MIAAECQLGGENRSQKFRVYAIGDLHSDSASFDEPRFKAYIDHIARDSACVAVAVGDYVEGRVPGQKHFDPDSLIPEARQHVGDYVSWALDRSERLLSPLRKAKTPLYMIQGNHDLYMQWTGFTAALADRLRAKFLKDEGMIRLLVSPIRRTKHSITGGECFFIYATHGSGGAGLPGAKVNAMQRYMGWVDADVIIAGHVHDQMVRVVPRIGMTNKGTLRFVERPVAMIRAPSFLRRVTPGVTNYASRKSYPTADGGLQYVESIQRETCSPLDGLRSRWRDWQRHEFMP